MMTEMKDNKAAQLCKIASEEKPGGCVFKLQVFFYIKTYQMGHFRDIHSLVLMTMLKFGPNVLIKTLYVSTFSC